VKTRYIEDDDIDTSSEREISLSPSTVLGIFLLLAIICAVFFGFGYSMGRRSTTASVAVNTGNDDAPLKATGGSKPAPGLANQNLTPADAAADAADRSDNPDLSRTASSDPVPDTPAAAKPQPHLQPAAAKPAPVPAPIPAVAAKIPAPHPVNTGSSAIAASPALVQIAAVSHQEDADMLVSALKRKGYTVSVRHEPQDKLFHIQLGPFPTRKDADAMRQRLAADGYNAIVK
jgi:cell division septation protein DedD